MTTPTTVQVRLQIRADTAADWTSVNPVLLTNELGLETDTKKFKVGDGTTAWNSLAYFPSIVSGGTVLGNLEIGTTGTLTFEGSTADGFETTLGVVDPTADRTILLPDQAGTVFLNTGGTLTGNVDNTSTGYFDLPAGTTAERPGSANSGMIRFNSDLTQFEGYNGTAWGTIGGGATGGGTDQWALEHDNTITTSYTITSGRNVISAGPITINAGATVTVPTGSNWSIV